MNPSEHTSTGHFVVDAPDEPEQTSHHDSQVALNALFVPESDAADLKAPTRSRGRPEGSKTALLVKTTELELEDFFYLRAVINGLPMHEAYARYYRHVASDAEGRLSIPHGNTLIHTSRRLINQIVLQAKARPASTLTDLVKTLQAPLSTPNIDDETKRSAALSFDDWYESVIDMYSENELPERYEEYLRDTQQMTRATKEILSYSAQLKAKLKALNHLQTELARRPTPDQDISLWLHPGLCTALHAQHIHTFSGLIKTISLSGPHWFRKISKIGQSRARRIEQWLDFHAETLGKINRTQPPRTPVQIQAPEPVWQLNRKPPAQVIATLDGQDVLPPSPNLPIRTGLVPLERLAVPPDLDGSQGMFRSAAPNQLGANTDLDAIATWLRSRAAAGKMRSAEAYRREIERFYLWCLIKTRTPLSSVSLAHAQEYQRFLQSIPHDWIYRKPVHRSDPLWRPFRSQLNPQSQNYALGVLKHFFRDLIDNGYLTSSPFKSIVETVATIEPYKMKTSRAFRPEDLELLRTALASLSTNISDNNLLRSAKARRTRLVIELAMRTGLRRNEIAQASLKGMQQAIVDGQSDDAFHVPIIGKGHRARTITLPLGLAEQVKKHHEDFRKLHQGNPQLIARFEESLPLIAVLEEPAGLKPESRAGQANKNGGLSSSGIYQVFKSFMRRASRAAATPEQAERINAATPHWTRHTFAHQVVKDNHNGFGLAHAKQLLGHRSLDTTGQYLTQDLSELTKAAKRINPLAPTKQA